MSKISTNIKTQPTTRTIKKQSKLKLPKLLLYGTLLIIASFFLWWMGVGIKNFIISELVTVDNLKWNKLEQDLVVEAMVFRNEVVVRAPQNGRLEKVVPEGERVRKGKVVARLDVATIENNTGNVSLDLRASQPGVVSYNVDGLEEVYSPINVEKFSVERVAQLTEKAQPEKKERIESGQAIFKLVKNLDNALVYLGIPKQEADPEYQKKWRPGEWLTVKVKAGQQEHKYQWPISQVTEKNNRIHLLVNLKSLPEELYTKRRFTISIINKQLAGYVVPQKAMVSKEGRSGVFVIYKQSAMWLPVEVKGTIGEQVVIVPPKDKLRSKITDNAAVITTPRYISEGQTINK